MPNQHHRYRLITLLMLSCDLRGLQGERATIAHNFELYHENRGRQENGTLTLMSSKLKLRQQQAVGTHAQQAEGLRVCRCSGRLGQEA